MNILGFIPARGGSKRIPKKNIKLFLGKPIISYPINCLKQLEIAPVVSTEDEEIAKVAVNCGAKVVKRPLNLADDITSATEVLLDYLEANKLQPEFSLMLYPFSVFATPNKIKDAFKIIKDKDEVFTVVRYGYPPQRGLKIKDGLVSLIDDSSYAHNTQDFEPVYHDAAQFFLFKTKALLQERRLFLKNSVPMIFNNIEAQDIDNEDDWKIAELKWRNKYGDSI